MYTRDDVKAFLWPSSQEAVTKVDGFQDLLANTAKWIRQYDPEFVGCATIYVDEDFPLVVDWLSLVCFEEDAGSKSLLARLQEHLEKEATGGKVNN